MIVSLFSNTLSNGIQGILSAEDRERFAMSYRTRHGNDLVLPPGSYRLDPSPVTYYPNSHLTEPVGLGIGDVPVRALPHFLDLEQGWIQCRIVSPSGKEVTVGPVPLRGVENGILQSDLQRAFDFAEMGLTRIILSGETRDLVGNPYVFGGSYRVWVARPLTFSTAVKVGTSFFPGNRFPAKVQIHPAVPAYVEVHVRYFPLSDIHRVQDVTYKGFANEFGYFIPRGGQSPLLLKEPGEYVVDIKASYLDPHNALWIGSQTGAGIVAEEDPKIRLHGCRYHIRRFAEEKETLDFKARYRLHDEDSAGVAGVSLADCTHLPPPYRSGDVLFVASTLDSYNNITPQMSQAFPSPELRESFLAGFGNGGLPLPWTVSAPSPDPSSATAFRLHPLMDVHHLIGPEGAGQLPILSRHRSGWNPSNFPEEAAILNYWYFSAIRPGFPAFTIIMDSTAYQTYWKVSPNMFGAQFNAGPTGDLPQDVYRIDAGLVYRDLDTGFSSYAAYASTLIVIPPESYANRVVAPAEEPLLRVRGKDYDLFLALEAGAILNPGEKIALACMVFPPVAALVRMEMTSPSGEKMVAEGPANQIGVFSNTSCVFSLNEPGVYSVKATASYEGKRAGVIGAPNNEYKHFVVPADRAPLISVQLPPRHIIDPTDVFSIPLEIDTQLRNPVLTWSVICPGIVMDQGSVPLEGSRFVYRFIPSQFAIQFPNFQVVDYNTGEPGMSKSTFLVFFVEGSDPEGKTVQDVAFVTIRDNVAYHFPSQLKPNEASRAILENETVHGSENR